MPVRRPPLSPGYIDAVAVQERDLNADDDFGDEDEVVYYHANTLFSVYALTEADENVVERYRYDAYGAATVLDDDWSADADGLSDVDNPYTFTGRRLDVGSGLMQYRHRCYAPALGRFITRDPLGYQDDNTLYALLGDRPVKGLDPLGLAEARTCDDRYRECLDKTEEWDSECQVRAGVICGSLACKRPDGLLFALCVYAYLEACEIQKEATEECCLCKKAHCIDASKRDCGFWWRVVHGAYWADPWPSR